MNVSKLYLLFFIMLAMSCHEKVATTRLSCCAKDNTAATRAMFAGPLTSASIYQSSGTWTDQHNHAFSMNELKGKVQVVAMIFTHCGFACPRMVEEMKSIEDSLPAADKDQVGFVLVSFDTERDTPSELNQFAIQKQLDNRWELLHGNSEQVRELSMLLDVKYQQLPDNTFSHSNAVIVIDKHGDVVRRFDGLGDITGLAVSTIHQLSNQ